MGLYFRLVTLILIHSTSLIKLIILVLICAAFAWLTPSTQLASALNAAHCPDAMRLRLNPRNDHMGKEWIGVMPCDVNYKLKQKSSTHNTSSPPMLNTICCISPSVHHPQSPNSLSSRDPAYWQSDATYDRGHGCASRHTHTKAFSWPHSLSSRWWRRRGLVARRLCIVSIRINRLHQENNSQEVEEHHQGVGAVEQTRWPHSSGIMPPNQVVLQAHQHHHRGLGVLPCFAEQNNHR